MRCSTLSHATFGLKRLHIITAESIAIKFSAERTKVPKATCSCCTLEYTRPVSHSEAVTFLCKLN